MNPQIRVRRADVQILADHRIDEIVCAGAPAEKWRANAAPDDDWASLSALMCALDSSSASSCVLMSTVDVFAEPDGVDEGRPADLNQEGAYGRHRARLEEFVQKRFDRSLILRLPGLYGPGLKKNLLFDLLHQPGERFAHGASTFQFYDVRELWGHVLLAQDAGLSLVHLPTEPLSAADVAREVFGVDSGGADRPQVAYDMRTRYSNELAGRSGAYLRTRDEVLASIAAWVASERRADP